MANFAITVDGFTQEVTPDELLIDALIRHGKAVPHLCYHPQLGPIRTCDTCLVEVDGALLRACETSLKSPVAVVTESANALSARLESFDKILANHELYCTVCDNNNGNCAVHNATADLRVEHQSRPFKPKPFAVDHSNPFYRYDPDQCILCGRCVEACQNVQVNETLSIRWEDPHPRVLWDGGESIAGSSCVSCGHCVTVCPCNALMEKSMIGHAGYLTGLPQNALDRMIQVVKAVEPETGYGPIIQLSAAEAALREQLTRRTKTVCTYCGVGCTFDFWTRDRTVLKVEPGPGPANGISTCVKGKFGWNYINDTSRLTSPLIRENGTFREATWAEALGLIASKLSQLKRDHGPDSMEFISSSKCTNEESYLFQKLARSIIGTNNVDNCSRYCQTPATKGLSRTVGYGGDSGSIHDIERAGLVITIGSNTAESHPVLATRVKRSHKLKGQRLIVADLREHEMARRADVHLRPNPGTDLVWISAISRCIIDQGLANRPFIDQWVNGFEDFERSVEPYTLAMAEKVTSIPAATLQQVAEEIAAADGVCILWAMGVTQHCQGADTSTAISNLLLLTGNYMRPGAGAYPLRGHNNVQGASDFGSMPDALPGYQKVDDAAVRAKFAAKWGTPVSAAKGLDNHEMIDAIFDGKLRGLYLIGEDLLTSDSNWGRVHKAMEKLEFFVVQDIFFTKTAQYADVVLPASASLEKEGTFTNTERRIQRLYQVFEPLGNSRPDWRIIQDVANLLGARWNYQHPSGIMREAAELCPIFAGVTYERLAGYQSLQWPVHADGTDEPLLFTKRFPFPDGKATFFPVHWDPPCEDPNPQYDLHLNNGRVLEHFEVGNQTYLVPGLKELMPDTFLEVSPELAAKRNLVDGTLVELTSKDGTLQVRVMVTDRVRGNQMYMGMNTLEFPVNRLTGPKVDKDTHTPAYKELAVNLKVIGQGAPPIPKTNSRNGHPTPQTGVEVERKWRRADYTPPGREKLVQLKMTER